MAWIALCYLSSWLKNSKWRTNTDRKSLLMGWHKDEPVELPVTWCWSPTERRCAETSMKALPFLGEWGRLRKEGQKRREGLESKGVSEAWWWSSQRGQHAPTVSPQFISFGLWKSLLSHLGSLDPRPLKMTLSELVMFCKAQRGTDITSMFCTQGCRGCGASFSSTWAWAGAQGCHALVLWWESELIAPGMWGAGRPLAPISELILLALLLCIQFGFLLYDQGWHFDSMLLLFEIQISELLALVRQSELALALFLLIVSVLFKCTIQ